MVTYMPGRAPIQAATPNPKALPQQAKADTPLPTPPKPKPKTNAASPNTNSPASPNPDSTTGADSLGSGNINIALASYFPTPKPDLSTLPRGTKGEVILDIALIICSLTLLTRRKVFWYTSMVIGVVGFFIGLSGFLIH